MTSQTKKLKLKKKQTDSLVWWPLIIASGTETQRGFFFFSTIKYFELGKSILNMGHPFCGQSI